MNQMHLWTKIHIEIFAIDCDATRFCAKNVYDRCYSSEYFRKIDVYISKCDGYVSQMPDRIWIFLFCSFSPNRVFYEGVVRMLEYAYEFSFAINLTFNCYHFVCVPFWNLCLTKAIYKYQFPA